MIDEIFTASVFASTIRLATPYILAALGETFSQRSGVLNLGVDGIMLMGAFFSFYVVFSTENLLLGVLVAALIGGLMGLAMAFISVTLKAEQGISGIGLYLFGLGMSELLFQELIGTPKSVDGFQRVVLPVLSDIEFLSIGEIFFRHNLLVYFAFAMVPISAFILNRTTFGLTIRAVGQNPAAADAMGVNVARVRYITVTIGGVFAGLAGASLSIALLKVFQQNLTSGMGFIAVALVYFGSWRPYGVMAGALIFSFVNALQLQINVKGFDIPSEFAVMMPYVITIIALVFASKRVEKPTALTKPFERGG
ncbi:MAG: ABC transporter permease [Anaerolineae bacterium]